MVLKLKAFTQQDYTEEHLRKYLRSYSSGKRNNKIRIVSQLLGDIQGKSVLDIGIGGGFFSRLCIQKKAKTISLDFADTILQYHRKNDPDFTLVQADAQHLPFKNESFDIVLALDVIEHLYSPLDFLNEVKRVLEKKGQLILITPNTANVFEKAVKFFFKIPLLMLGKFSARKMKQEDIAHCTHVKEFSVKELTSLLKESNFKIRKFNTFNENLLYRILNPIISCFLLGSLKAYKWRKVYFLLEK